MKTLSKKVKIILAVAILVVITGIALWFILKPDNKIVAASLVDITLPTDTDNIIGNIEEVSIIDKTWNDYLLIKGWVLKQNVKEKTRDLLLVFKSGSNTLVFDPVNDNLSRPGVSEYCKLTGSADNHGYEGYIPLEMLKDSAYEVGYLIKDESGQYHAMSGKKMKLGNGTVRLENYQIEAHKVAISMRPETDKIKYYFETFNVSDNVFTISGWGFLKGLNTDSSRAYIILRKDNKNVIFTTVPQLRTGVTTYFKDEFGVNLDHSGYSATIDGKLLPKGKYEVLLYIVRGEHIGLTYSNQFIEIGI